MKSATVFLPTIGEVKEFVGIISRYSFDIDLASGRHTVDAKSIMGIFSLDLSKPLRVEFHTDDPADFFEVIARFITE